MATVPIARIVPIIACTSASIVPTRPPQAAVTRTLSLFRSHSRCLDLSQASRGRDAITVLSWRSLELRSRPMKNVTKTTLAVSAFALAALFSFSWSEQDGISLSVESAQARVGRPLTPLSGAGVARRQYRRAAYGTGVVGAGVVGAAA